MALPVPPPRPAAKTSAVPPRAPSAPAKKFTVAGWSSANRGEKVLLYAESGMGKTTLASTAPDPVFIGIDDGGARIKNPITGEDLKRVEGVESFADVRAALAQPNLFEDSESVIIDTVTRLQDWSLPFIFQTVPAGQNAVATSIESYGYGKGYRHVYDAMLGILALVDTLTAQGKHVILVAQNEVAAAPNAGSDNFLKEGPRLQHTSQGDVAGLYREWADHVCRISYQGIVVKDKKAVAGCTERAIFVQPEVWFYAKSRTIKEPVINFGKPSDDDLWKFMGIK
jgi:hypothetical protein